MLKDERRFDFIPQKKWKSLSKEDMSQLQSYKSYYGHYKRTLKKVDELKAKLKAEEEKVKKYVTKLYKINKSIDHLRSDYHFSFTIYKVKSRNYHSAFRQKVVNKKITYVVYRKSIIFFLEVFVKSTNVTM